MLNHNHSQGHFYDHKELLHRHSVHEDQVLITHCATDSIETEEPFYIQVGEKTLFIRDSLHMKRPPAATCAW